MLPLSSSSDNSEVSFSLLKDVLIELLIADVGVI
jgi:hypothetical protein